MLAILQMQECPQLRIPSQDHVTATASITAIGTAFGHEFFPVKV